MDENYSEFLKFAILDNYVKFNGKANVGSIIGKMVQQYPEVKKNIQNLRKEITEEIENIKNNSMDHNREVLEKLSSKYKEEKEERGFFDSLKIPEGSKVVTAFPPGPEKYPHIGHAKAALLNYELAKEYGGKFYLRFEDTNPELVREEFYDIIQDNLKWLGIKWDRLDYASDYIPKLNEFALKLIKNGKAYMCTCSPETMKENRDKGEACACRNRSVEENVSLWEKFNDAKKGSMVLRLKIDLKHKNSTMRDPTIYRIVEAKHPRLKEKIRAIPTYDFQNPVLDGLLGVTHRFRSKEFEMRSELHEYIREILDLYPTKTIEFGRFNLKGMLMSGRKIRELLNEGKIDGWDDPNVGTIVALKRRGFTKEAIKNFVLSTGFSKNEATIEWSDFLKHNKRVLDKKAKRFFFVRDPVKITIENTPEKIVELKLNPNSSETRKIKINSEFFIERKDFESLSSENEIFRLIDAVNFKRENDKFVYVSDSYEDFKGKGSKIIHFAPVDYSVDATIYTPEHELIRGKAEKNILDLAEGEIIQFERVAFCRLDNKDKMLFFFTHD